MYRILYICDISAWGGSSLSLMDMVSALGKEGNFFFLLNNKGPLYYALKDKGYNCIVFPFAHNSVSIELDVKSLIRNCIFLIKYFIFNPLCAYYVGWKLHGKIDVVHSNTSAISIGYRIAKIMSVKHVWHIREFLDYYLSLHIIGGKQKLMKRIHSSDSVICITRPLVTYWNLEGKRNVYVIPDAVKYRSEGVVSFVKKKEFVFCCGILSDFKGADYATEAFGKSGLSAAGYRLVFIGGYNEKYKRKLLAIAKKYNADDSLVFCGFLEDKEIKKIVSKATAFLQCSIIEGLGRTVIEAMFWGCPVIARNNGGTIDFVENMKNGLLYNTIDECVEQIKYVVSNNVNWMIVNAYNTAQGTFAIEDYGNKISAVYDKLTKSF